MAPCYIAVQPSAEQHSCALLGHVDVTSKADCEAAFKYTQTAAGFSHTASVGQSSLSVRLRGCYGSKLNFNADLGYYSGTWNPHATTCSPSREY